MSTKEPLSSIDHPVPELPVADVERAQAGDGGAFGELYEQFAPEIFRYLLRHLNGRRESAEDLTEEVFVKVLERLGSYQFRDCRSRPGRNRRRTTGRD